MSRSTQPSNITQGLFSDDINNDTAKRRLVTIFLFFTDSSSMPCVNVVQHCLGKLIP